MPDPQEPLDGEPDHGWNPENERNDEKTQRELQRRALNLLNRLESQREKEEKERGMHPPQMLGAGGPYLVSRSIITIRPIHNGFIITYPATSPVKDGGAAFISGEVEMYAKDFEDATTAMRGAFHAVASLYKSSQGAPSGIYGL